MPPVGAPGTPPQPLQREARCAQWSQVAAPPAVAELVPSVTIVLGGGQPGLGGTGADAL